MSGQQHKHSQVIHFFICLCHRQCQELGSSFEKARGNAQLEIDDLKLLLEQVGTSSLTALD